MKSRILIVEDNVTLSQMQKDWLTREGYDVMTAIDAVVARRHIRRTDFDLILSDVRLPEGDGLSLLAWLKKEKTGIPVVIMTEYASYPDAVKAIKMGAKDYLPKPVHRERLFEIVKELVHPAVTIQHSLERLFKRDSAKAREALHLAELVAPADISVLILGANGTGKESIARTIHVRPARTYSKGCKSFSGRHIACWCDRMFSISFRENVLDGTRYVLEYIWFHLKRLIGTKCSDEIERWRG